MHRYCIHWRVLLSKLQYCNLSKLFCKLGFHDWSPNHGGMRVCLAKGCSAIDFYFGITGKLRYLREHYTREEIEEMARS